MKSLLAIISLGLSFSAFSFDHEVSFSYSGNESWGRSYYNCDYAQVQTESFFITFGATYISIRCTGGLESGQFWPLGITASYDAPVLSGVNSAVNVKGDRRNPSCGLNAHIVRSLLPHFSNITVISKSDSCSSPSANYSYEFSITL
jgi:hypothetical protein